MIRRHPQPRGRLARRHLLLAAAVLLLAAVGCGSDDDTAPDSSTDQPTVAVTTSLLGDVVEQVVGDEAEVTVLMPPGADPHDVQLSAQQAAEIREADALITNGGGFEEGMLDTLEAAESDGVPTYEALEAVDPIESTGDHDHSEEGEAHSDEEGEQEGTDPHFFTDPARMAVAAQGIADFLVAEVPALDTEAFQESAGAEVTALEELDAEIEEVLSAIPEDDRRLVTNHEVFGYFADRYGFEVVGVVVPGGGTGGEPSAAELSELADTIESEDVPAIFADVSSPESLSQTLAGEVGDIEVVSLYTESLGEEDSDGATYDALVRTNAQRMVDALT